MARRKSRSWQFAQRRPKRPWPFTIIALTGSIAMGKSTVSALLRRWNWTVYDADAEVHRLMRPGGAAVAPIAKAFDNVVGPNGVDRTALGRIVFADPAALARLEKIIHPMMGKVRRRILMHAALNGRRMMVLDVPLLFETVHERIIDIIAVVSAPAFLQRQRAMARPGMTAERLKAILARQTPDYIKRQKADLVIPSGLGKRETLRHLIALRKIARLRKVDRPHLSSS